MTVRQRKIKEVTYHLLAWIVILSVNVSIFGGYFGHDKNMYELFFKINYPIWMIYVATFYLNYLFLIPRFLFNQEYLVYSISSVLLLSLSFVAVQEYKYSENTVDMTKALPIGYKMKPSNPMVKSGKDNDVKQMQILHSPFNPEFHIKVNDSTSNSKSSVTVQSHLYIDELYRSRETKRHFYGDFFFAQNENMGLATVKRRSQHNKFSLNESRNSTQIYLLLLIYAISLATGFGKKTVQRNKIIADISREKTESELSYLKQQINPHFLFNALNSIYSLVLPHSDAASDAVIKLSSILRYMLYETDRSVVSLDKEFEILKDYIALQNFKFTNMTEISFETKGSPIGYTIEPLILLPLVENAFKYGADNITPSFIKIEAEVDNGELIFVVENRIVVSKKDNENSGIGIKNIRRRLDLIYENAYTLDLSPHDDIYSVKLKLKLQ